MCGYSSGDTYALNIELFPYVCAGKMDHQAHIHDDNNNASFHAWVSVTEGKIKNEIHPQPIFFRKVRWESKIFFIMALTENQHTCRILVLTQIWPKQSLLTNLKFGEKKIWYWMNLSLNHKIRSM